uniref:Uncharacterized protein n=1 Tax=Arundo donax TaxID=35708 RepID=A0A0A9FJE4_ARUDO
MHQQMGLHKDPFSIQQHTDSPELSVPSHQLTPQCHPHQMT